MPLIFKENKTKLLSSALSSYIFAKFHAALRAQSSCLEVSSGVLPSKLGAQGFSLMSVTFLDNTSRWPILSQIRVSYQVRPQNFMVCPAEAFILTCPAFRGTDFIGSEF